MHWIGQIKQTACFDFRVSVRLHLWLLCSVILSQTSGLNSMCVCACVCQPASLFILLSVDSAAQELILQRCYTIDLVESK